MAQNDKHGVRKGVLILVVDPEHEPKNPKNLEAIF
jgi:hypothetical protein